MNKPITDIIRKVWHDQVAIEIGPCGDGLMVHVTNKADKESVAYYGNVDFSFAPEVAREIAKAMIACADEMDKEGFK